MSFYMVLMLCVMALSQGEQVGSWVPAKEMRLALGVTSFRHLNRCLMHQSQCPSAALPVRL